MWFIITWVVLLTPFIFTWPHLSKYCPIGDTEVRASKNSALARLHAVIFAEKTLTLKINIHIKNNPSNAYSVNYNTQQERKHTTSA